VLLIPPQPSPPSDCVKKSSINCWQVVW
jgi:hypothetical protein